MVMQIKFIVVVVVVVVDIVERKNACLCLQNKKFKKSIN